MTTINPDEALNTTLNNGLASQIVSQGSHDDRFENNYFAIAIFGPLTVVELELIGEYAQWNKSQETPST